MKNLIRCIHDIRHVTFSLRNETIRHYGGQKKRNLKSSRLKHPKNRASYTTVKLNFFRKFRAKNWMRGRFDFLKTNLGQNFYKKGNIFIAFGTVSNFSCSHAKIFSSKHVLRYKKRSYFRQNSAEKCLIYTLQYNEQKTTKEQVLRVWKCKS